MPVVETAIAKQIEAFMTKTTGSDLTDESKKQIQNFASDLSKVIATAIRSATVTVSPGIPVATAGTPAAQTGATTGPGTGTLS